MAESRKEISGRGVAQLSGLEVYITITVDSVEYTVPVVCEDIYGNFHKILRTTVGNTIQ